MITTKGFIKKKHLDDNNHVNIAEYIKFADISNNKLFKNTNFKKKIYLVAKKTFIENKSELTFKEKWEIKSFIIKIDKMSVITRHEMYSLNQKKIVSVCNFLLIPLNKKNRRIKKMTNIDINKLKINLKKNYFNPF